MKYDIPGLGELEIKTIILDLNGTISVGGQIVDGVKERLEKLKKARFRLVLFTGNTRGDASMIAEELSVEWMFAGDSLTKKNLSDELDPATCASIGNGLIDRELMQNVALGVAVLQAEGVHVKTLYACDLVIPSVNDALDLFIDSNRLIASLRS